MPNLLDELIADQNARGLQGPSATQLGTGQAGAVPAVTVAPASRTVLPTDSFFNQPSLWEQNRSRYDVEEELNLDNLRTRAAAGRFALERAQARAPQEDRLLDAQINASGSHDRFLREQDQQTLQHTAGFFNHMSDPNAPKPNDPGYDQHLLAGILKNPRFVETTGGKQFLERLAKTNDTHTSVADLKKLMPAGFDVASVNMGPRGQSVTMKPVDEDAALEKSAKDYGLTLGRIRAPINAEVGRRGKKGEVIGGKDVSGGFIGDEKGDIVRVENAEGKQVALPVAEYLRLGGKLSPEGAAREGAAPAADLTALARKALADPNASPAHKARAQAILSGR